MTHVPAPYAVFLAVWVLTGPFLSPAWGADLLHLVRSGEEALAYSSGAIQRSTPQDGFVHVITGDNQTTGNRMILGSRDLLYLRLNEPGSVAPGDLFTIYKRLHTVHHPATGHYLGYLVNRLAVVQVTQTDKTLTTVQIVHAYAPVSPGDPVMKFVPPGHDDATAMEPAAGDLEGQIVELQSNMGSLNLVAQGNIVYLDRGQQDGMTPGIRMNVLRSGGSLPQRIVGELKILSVEDRTATALITKSTAHILRGDQFRAKSPAPDTRPIAQSLLRSEKAATPHTGKFQVQEAARETRINLNDLTTQLRFESGEAAIRPDGYQSLDELIAYLKTEAGDRLIRIEGHADNKEISPSLKARYRTNWDLSNARAQSVLRYLTERGGIDSAKLSSIGYGDTKPVASNATETGRRKNRRVEIVLSAPEPAKDQPARTTKPPEADDIPHLPIETQETSTSESDSAPPEAPLAPPQ